jgi:hypothetical protein
MGRIMDVTHEAADHGNVARRARHVVGLALVVWLVTLFGAAGASAHTKVEVTCTAATGGSVGCDGWYRSAVTIDWTVESLDNHPFTTTGCEDTTLTDDTAGTQVTCTAEDPGTPPNTVARVIQIDKTDPVVTGGRPARGADANGWYTRPLSIEFDGSDSTSGLAGCTSLTYRGPDSATASVHGTCTDVAGNVSAPFAYGLKYDETPPSLTSVRATTGDRRVVVRWSATGGADAVEVVRSPGLKGAPASVVVRGRGVSFADTQVRNGNRYSYEVRAVDSAGNVASRTVRAIPRRRLIAPGPGAIVDAATPPLLRWTPVRGARYYNVQLFRDGRKIMSAWPTRARLQLKRSWSNGGTRVRFGAGTYRWLVWPGRGARSKADYGARIGIRKFVVP